MTVTIKYLAQVKLFAGVASERVESAGACTAVELIAERARRGGPELQRALLTADGRLQPTILLFVNDRQTDHASARPLSEGDVITVLAPMAGG